MKRHPLRLAVSGVLGLSGKVSIAIGLAATAGSFASPAWSQAKALEEVVVTARKKEESLQESPVAITAFSGTRLQEANITNLTDFNKVIPNLDVQGGNGNAGVANIYIRGVGQRNTEPNIDSGVGIYLDGVYVGRADGALLDVNDLQSVQVLRGPQGTLFGKNTTGGALVFTTNRPGPEFEGSLLARTGNYNRRDAEGMINIPLADDLLYTRLSVVSRKRDGYIENIVDGKDYNDEDRISAVWQVRWLPTEDLTVDFNANYGKTSQKTRLQKCVPLNDPQYTDWAWQKQLYDRYLPFNFDGRLLLDYCQESNELDTYEALSDLGGSYRAENKGFSISVDWALTENMTFKSISGWRNTVAGQDDDLDQLGIPLLHRTNDLHPFAKDRETDQYSQEFQLSGDAWNGALSYAVGVYGFAEKTPESRTVNRVGPLQTTAFDNVILYNTTATEMDVDNKAWSVFAQIDFNFAESWRLTLGNRYTWEKRELTQTYYIPDRNTLSISGNPVSVVGGGFLGFFFGSASTDFNPNHGFILDPAKPAENMSVEDDAWTPMVSLQYFLPEGNWVNGGSAYLTLSKGFRSGGISEDAGGLREFEPEEVMNYELGIKVDAFDNRVRLNTALFHMEYDNRQLTTVKFDTVSGLPSGATINAKESTITGIELESMFVPIDGLEITLNATWSRGRIQEFLDTQIAAYQAPNPGLGIPEKFKGGISCTLDSVMNVIPISECVIDRSDENLPRLAKRTFMAAIQYEWQTPVGIIIPRIQGAWKFDQENCFDRTSCESGLWYTDRQFDLSARLTWLSMDQKWMAALYGSNLTKEEYSTGGTALADALSYGGQTYAEPRMYGAELQYRW